MPLALAVLPAGGSLVAQGHLVGEWQVVLDSGRKGVEWHVELLAWRQRGDRLTKQLCGRQHQRPVWGTNCLLAAEFKPPRGGGGGLIQSGGGFVEGRCRPRARRRRRCRVVGSRRSGGRAGTAWSQHPHPVGVSPSTTRPAPPPRGASGDVGAADPRGSHHRCRAGSA
jgi:hypothetical protein